MKSIFSFLLALQAVSALPLIERQIQAASIAGSWIAELSENANLTATLEEVQRVAGVKAKSSFSIGGFQGFAFDGDDSTLDALQDVESLKKIESEYIVETTVPVGELQSRALVRQSSSTWGLSRISSRSRGQSGYIYDNTAGQGTFVYILDTGVFTQHNDFGGRAVTGANFISGESSSDGNGHGTHCAGTVGGTVYGAVSPVLPITLNIDLTIPRPRAQPSSASKSSPTPAPAPAPPSSKASNGPSTTPNAAESAAASSPCPSAAHAVKSPTMQLPLLCVLESSSPSPLEMRTKTQRMSLRLRNLLLALWVRRTSTTTALRSPTSEAAWISSRRERMFSPLGLAVPQQLERLAGRVWRVHMLLVWLLT